MATNALKTFYCWVRDRLRGRDLLEEVWTQRDEAEVESLRERVKRLQIIEHNTTRAAAQLQRAGLNREAEVEKAKAVGLRARLRGLREKKRDLELRILSEQARYYREGHR